MCRRAFVSGRVQGVGYRAFCCRAARDLGVSGHARNLADGRVEVLACGAVDAVGQLLQRLHDGPRWAKVSTVEVEDAECCAPGFSSS